MLPERVPGTSEQRSTAATAARYLILAVLLCALALIVFFRDFFLSGCNLIAGDLGDNRFIIAILEHWRMVTHGQVSFTSPNFFWPEQGVLGYSESMFLMSLPYIVGRSIGLDHYLAFEMAFIVFKAVGFFSMLWLLRSVVGLSRPVALLGSVLFTLSNLYFITVGHSQLATVAFTPLVAALACSAWRAFGNGRILVAHAYAAACGILTALIFFTSFYIGWFMILAAAGFIVIAALARILEQASVSPVVEWLQAAFARRWLWGVAALAFMIALIPFLVTYVPTLKHTGGRTFVENMLYSGGPRDLVNVGSKNWMWSRVLKPSPIRAENDSSAAAGERTVGWPPIILLLAIGGGVVSCIQLLGMDRTGAARHRARLLIVICSVSFLSLWVLSIRVGRWSLWWLVFKLVPGGSGIRAPVRFNFVLNLLLVLSACLMLEQLRHRGKRVLFGVLAALLVAEQINTASTHGVRRSTEDAILARIKRPPSGCSSFFVTAPAQPGRPFYGNQTDAMLVARAANLPTINGLSGWFPPDWKLLMFDGEYIDHVRKWALDKQVERGLCGLDLRNGSWTTDLSLNNAYTPGEVLDFRTGGHALRFEGEGWGDPEPGGSWTVGGRSVLMLQLPAPPAGDLVLTVEAHAFTTPQRTRFDDTLMVNGRAAAQWSITDHEPVIQKQVRLPAELIRSRDVRIEFINHDPRSPADFGLSGDTRKVGLALHTLRLDATTYSPGEVLDFRQGGNASYFEGEGWAKPEPAGSWTVGGRSVLVVQLPAPPASDQVLSIEAHAFTPPQRRRFDDTLMVNGRALAEWPVTDQEPILRRQVLLPAALIRSRVLRIEFINHDPRSPADLGLSGDTRKVGLSLHTLRIGATTYSPGEELDFRKGGNASRFESEGWSDPEPEGSWTVGGRSVLELQLPELPTSDLLLTIEAHAFTAPQRTRFDDTLMVNGRIAAQWSITDQEPILRKQVRLPAGSIRSRLIRIEFINHDPRSPADLGLSGDTRKVGLSLHTLRLANVLQKP